MHRTRGLPALKRVAMLVLAVALVCTRALADDYQAVASTDKAWRPRAARLNLGAALQIAEATMKKRGLSVADFQSPRFRYDYELYYPDLGAGDYAWAFVYVGKAAAPDNRVVVIVNDRTRYAEFIPGH